MKTENKLDIENLSYGNIRQAVKPLPPKNEYGELGYELISPTVTNDNREALIEQQGLDSDATDSEINDSILYSGAYDPMVDWYIPLWDIEHTEQEIANILEETNLVLITIPESSTEPASMGLCLSACDSDFTWDIVRAFILLGFYPPVDYCHLPKIAEQVDRGEVEACNISLKAVADRLLREIASNKQVCQEL